MPKKVPFYILWDWKSIIGVLTVIALLGTAYYVLNLPNEVRTKRIENYKGRIHAQITSIEDHDVMWQSNDGTKIFTYSKIIEYKYKVSNDYYTGKDEVKIKGKSKSLDHLKAGDQIQIAFDSLKPSSSLILVK